VAELVATRGADILGPVLGDLDATPPDLADATRRLAALTDVLDLPPRSGCRLDARPAQDALHRVYASRVFANLDKGEPRSFLDEVGAAVLRALGGIAARLDPRALAYLVALLLLVLGALGVRAWRRLPALLVPAVRTEPPGSGSDADQEWAAALAAAATGDRREAVRRAFRSALLSVMLRGRLQIDPSWTTGQLLARAAGDADLVAALAPAAASFDRAWYSGIPVSMGDWEQARARCQAVRELAGRRHPARVA